MSHSFRLFAVCAALAALLAEAAPAPAGQQDHGLSADEERALDTAFDALITAEAEDFMIAYAQELRAGDRAAIARRYHRDGAWRVGHGEKRLESWVEIQAYYASAEWQPPARFEWRDLSYETLSDDAFVVVGLFDWDRGDGQAPVTFSYTGLLVREDGELRIRLEDESGPRTR